MKSMFWMMIALVATLLFTAAGCTVVGASLTATGAGISIEGSLAGATTEASIGLPDFLAPDEPPAPPRVVDDTTVDVPASIDAPTSDLEDRTPR